jgi:sporulation protein YlmC with PRC-barrel domain
MSKDEVPHIMLSKVKTLKGYRMDSLDGEIGKVKEFYFDDHFWTIRYLVAEPGSGPHGRQVLISPYALRAVEKEEKSIAINLTKKQIEDSPLWDSDKPVSRQFEIEYYGYYDWPAYWGGPYMWGDYPYIERDPEKWSEHSQEEEKWDPHLQSTDAVSGYHVHASDGEIGHVEDFIIDDESWAIRYLIINTRNLWSGKRVLISPKWIEHVSWDESKIFVNVTQEAVRQSPEYTEESLLTREFEVGLHKHYDRRGYWVDDPAPK